MSGIAVRMLMASDVGSAVGARFAQWISHFPTKVLARRFDASPRTVQAWRGGALAQSTTLVAMVAVWGEPFLEFIFAPVLTESDISAERRIARIEGDLAALKRDMKGDADDAHHPSAGRAAVGESRRLVHRAGKIAFPSVAAVLIAATLAQQIAPVQSNDMARLRHGVGRIVRVVRGGRETA